MDMSAFRFSCPTAHMHHTALHEPRCAGERREQRRRREEHGHVRGCVHVCHRVRVRVHVPTATARTAQGPHAAAACVGSSWGSHRASDVEGPAPAAPESIESASSPVPLTQVARREAAHAVPEVVLEPVIQSMTLISGHPFIKPVYTLVGLVGLEGTGFVLSSSTGAAWGTLFGSSQKLRADYVATALGLGLRALQGWWQLPVWVGWEGMTRPHEL
ncbi:hypothetical protein JB92DRAFT_2831220 [Gautieria morchelliformis]|nr:hypothetical protein JB92DRAFT_2831220 [Gautieria morchelliformis]